jgi:hypothetical protein
MTAGMKGLGNAMPARSRTARARDRNHRAGRFATALLLMLAAPLAMPMAQEAPAAPAAINFTQRGVPAEATAENGVIARERALANGRRAAWERLASSAGISRQLSDAQIEQMTASIIIEEERTAPTRYTGRITVNFNPGRVRALAGGAIVGEGGGTGGGGTAPGEAGRPPAPVPVAATVEVVALYGSLQDWLELRRRLKAGAARLEVVAISTDRARLRLSLRAAPGVAAEEFARQGVTMTPGSGAPGDAWRVGLAGRS